jgi:hypothetical protein
MDLKDFIKLKRPSLSASSIITYASILRSLYAKVFQSKDVDVSKFDDTKSILAFLKDVPGNKRKTILSALVIVTDNADYRDQMIADIHTYNKNISTQVKTPEQEASWVTMDEIKKIYDALAKQANVLYKKETLSSADLQEIQNYLIIALLGGVFIPPRRSLDYTNFKIREIDPALNYLDKKTLVFNSYKTARTYGEQTVECPPALLKILKKFISVNKTEWLLFDSNGGKLSPVKLNQRLTKVLGKGRGVNSLRHSYLTGKYADTIKVNEELEKDMTAMGSSKSQSTGYIKKE